MNNKVGIYVHIPFCSSKCPYCNFYTTKFSSKLAIELSTAIIQDMKAYKNKGITADTLYFGGGTPSLMPTELILNIIQTAIDVFNLDGEITIEANPNSISTNKLNSYFSYGINRISFGMQSVVDKELLSLGRHHNINQVIQSVENAKNSGFTNISIDVMLGTPYQDINSLNESIDFIKKINIHHISAYLLKIEENTPFFNSKIIENCVSDDTSSDMYLHLVKSLEDIGLMQYEISNFSKIGLESKHNLKYWNQDDYLGFGPSAHSLFNNQRYCYDSDLEEYIKNHSPKNKIILDDNINVLEEYVMLSIRTKNGIDIIKLKNKYFVPQDKLNILKHEMLILSNQGFLTYDKTISLTPKGFLLSNTIILKILDVIT